MIEVTINNRDPRRHLDEVDHALRELRKQIKKSGLLQDLRKHEYYVAPSKKRKLKAAESFKLRKREERKTQWQKKKFDV